MIGFALFGALTYLPLFQQVVRGLSFFRTKAINGGSAFLSSGDLARPRRGGSTPPADTPQRGSRFIAPEARDHSAQNSALQYIPYDRHNRAQTCDNPANDSRAPRFSIQS